MEEFKQYLTFNDVLLKPGCTDFERGDITLATKLSRNIMLAAPFVSSPMDTVTESKLAIALARVGGIGVIHRNLTIEQQAKEVKKTKRAGCLVAAAVGSSSGYEARVAALVKAGVDAVLIDSAHGYQKKVIDAVEYIKSHYEVDVIAGSVATAEAAEALIAAGADSLRIGMGPGAICSTRVVSGMGVPQLSSILEIVKVSRKAGVPLIADGGIVNSGDAVKAIAAGADTVMMGRMFAGTVEAPGNEVLIDDADVPANFRSSCNGAARYRFKAYRGMGSIASMKRGVAVSSEDEFHGKSYTNKDTLIAEGVEGLVPCTGTVSELIEQLRGGLLAGMYYVGTRTIPALQRDATFIRITQASLIESHPHDLVITNSGGNYN